MELEDLGEQLYNLLAQVLNRPENRAFFDSIRGEYGVLWYLLTKKEAVSAGELKEKLHVVPGRMTDILTALEKKGLIIRQKNKTDKRGVDVVLQKRVKKKLPEEEKKFMRSIVDCLRFWDMMMRRNLSGF